VAVLILQMGEMASAWPTSSGPQEYAFQLASPRFKRAMSYATGWSMSIMYLFALLAHCSRR
jgi:amino acid permease